MKPELTDEQRAVAAWLKQAESIRVEPPSGETSLAYRLRMKKKEEVARLQVGDRAADRSVFAGVTADGTQHIFAMPIDFDIAMTFNYAAQVVRSLNADKALGHDDWQIPSLETLCVLYQNQNAGALKGTFRTNDDGRGPGCYPDWYWSCTEDHGSPPLMRGVRFSDGGKRWNLKEGGRFSCRPVRLVAASAPVPAKT